MFDILVRLAKAGDIFAEAVGEVWRRFWDVPEIYRPIALLFLLLAAALVMLYFAFFVRSSISKATGPFRKIPAPPGYAPRPQSYNPEKWFEYFVIRRYIEYCRPHGIGWFTPRIVAWIGMMSVLGVPVLGALRHLGLSPIDDVQYAMLCLAGLLLALTHGYAHNAGRRDGLDKKRIEVREFIKAFTPLAAVTIAMFIIELGKHQAIDVARWAWKSLQNT